MSKSILVVGGSSGIGLALVESLQAEGHQVFSASRHQSEILTQKGVSQITLDVKGEVHTALTSLPDTLHGLAYCPGSINLKPFQRLSPEEFQEDFEINVLGAVKVLQATMKPLKKAQGASVVLFSTVAARLGMNFHASIAVAKSGVEGLAKTLAAEWAPYHIRVNTVAPSLTDTPLAAKLLSTPERREASDKRHPIGRVGTPEDVAALAHFLLVGASSWLTGQVLGIDGGMGGLKP
ncbi:MAG: SDR family oxidoreductase [Microscillaceae bacterium]|nr:SDR family oxidoreductase [Microscillaceae bacterium]